MEMKYWKNVYFEIFKLENNDENYSKFGPDDKKNMKLIQKIIKNLDKENKQKIEGIRKLVVNFNDFRNHIREHYFHLINISENIWGKFGIKETLKSCHDNPFVKTYFVDSIIKNYMNLLEEV
ncbi:MAG: hypothetical protein RsTaC01_0875 [Candidatus Paraimprobicoccus trichonymphae]|uniref:Uncharacterized protein n=1 Tax=Candidatus Paraimprobicoccus trichonymphae TaxID=3033793 RepID=A0AA48I4V6_9FIRM|nr:MAG: hypothetical protein RsTaC01_0875 [Candidatus Paraimprobicoccus trichonymphae]